MSKHLGKAIRIGELRKRVIIQSYSDTIVVASKAQLNTNYADIATVWAKVRQLSGFAVTKSKNIGAAVTHEIIIKFRSDVTTEEWIDYDGNKYRIRTVEDAGDEKKRFLILMCELQAKVDV